jgi:hypothetical protein
MDVDATELLAARRQLQEATGERFGVTALVARFVVAGLARHPLLNSSFDAEHDEIVMHGDVNLGMAAQTPRGLLVPVVHGAGRMSLRELRDAIGSRSEEAASGAFPPAALTGGTFTLNNYGTLGVDGSAAIINHPEAGMLGIGRLVERPWVVDGALAVRTVTELTLSFDHRVCDGAEAAAVLTFVARCIERPVSVLADLWGPPPLGEARHGRPGRRMPRRRARGGRRGIRRSGDQKKSSGVPAARSTSRVLSLAARSLATATRRPDSICAAHESESRAAASAARARSSEASAALRASATWRRASEIP